MVAGVPAERSSKPLLAPAKPGSGEGPFGTWLPRQVFVSGPHHCLKDGPRRFPLFLTENLPRLKERQVTFAKTPSRG